MYVKVFFVVAIKCLILFAMSPYWSFDAFTQWVTNFFATTSRIYEESVQEYILQDVFYLEVAEGKEGDKVFADLQQQGMIDEYSQPFVALDIPYYRVHFSVREDIAKRTIALLLSNGTLVSVEDAPLFHIQQSFAHSQKSNTIVPWQQPIAPSEKREQLNERAVRFSTQQIEKKNFERQWYLDEIGLVKDNLSCLSTQGQKIKVAIIDNAFVSSHPSFSSSIKKSIDVADGDSAVSPPLKDEEWMHGTHSAWLIAGKKFWGKWIIGTSLGSTELYLLKATTDASFPTEITHGIEAFAKAVELDVDIISLSWWAYMDFPVFRKVVQKALDKGIVVIAAAGNYGSDDLFYPAAYEEVISVWSFDKQFERSAFSNYGSWVDVYAPGEQLVVPDSEDGFADTDGTSAAAPLFAWVYALLMRTFWTTTGLEKYYIRTANELNYLDIQAMCTSPQQEVIAPWSTEPSAEPELPLLQMPTEHPSPTIQQVKQPLPDFRTQIADLARLRWWRIVASSLIVILLVIWAMKKPLPPPEST